MSDLIDRDRAVGSLNGQILSSPELAIVDQLITVVSRAIENYCRRAFGLVNRDERYDGQEDPVLLLHHYPVTAIERVACAPTPVVSARNEAGGVQRATVRVLVDGLVLTRVASGVTVVDTISFASAPTLSALAAAITALGNGWSASVTAPDYDPLASADLAACPGTWAARAQAAELRLHLREIADYELNARLGVLRRVLGWPGGASFFRIVYTAGYGAVPEDVQEACAQLVAQLFWQSKRDPGLAHASSPLGNGGRPATGWPTLVRDLLAPYRRVPRAA
jgi:hypothetical protein